ncbi:MAG: hypothetical protein J1F11_04540 [Oscillospiraceae bacterium]|nr:hypothetical protein [Oscillospiraceae bacterium]
MSKKIALCTSVLAVLTGTLSACQAKPIENPDLPAVATTRMTTSLWVEGTFETDPPEETEPETVTSADGQSVPIVTPADQIYKMYPMKIIYQEKRPTAVTVTTESVQENIYTPDGRLAAEFSAEYPVISGIDENVCQRINNEIKLFVDGTFDELREYAKVTEEILFEPAHTWKINMDGVDFAGDGYDINGNIFTVYFADYGYGAPAAHGSETPTPMIFDLRTGDRIKFSELIGDSGSFADVLESWFGYYQFAYGGVPYGMLDADAYADILRQENEGSGGEKFGMDDSGVFRVAGNDADERMTVHDGCVGFYLAAYEYGSFADGIRRVDIPVNEIFPCLNEKGRSLFEGYVSAGSVPANVIEYKGGRYFDTTMWVPNIVDENAPTDGDVEFVSLFENAWKYYHKLYGDE